ncbi:MAG TPA: 2-C-methyl-D-erythritol 2,4-cyclodiphosphate synthase [Clostridiales bacterium]|nr:2-C-methyl-D-erythritol 2,4-cyclodiphosphate synthase [Clostridiales bacterium]
MERETIPFVDVILPAAGRSSRMGGVDKLLLQLEGEPVLLRTAKIFDKFLSNRRIIIVTSRENYSEVSTLVEHTCWQGEAPVICLGGATRQESVFAALPHLSGKNGLVAVHDAARPFLEENDLLAVLSAAKQTNAAFLCTKMHETVHCLDNNVAVSTLHRETLVSAQTPQVFSASLFLEMAEFAPTGAFTDECSIALAMGISCTPVFGSRRNRKLTTREDLPMETTKNFTIGQGYDVHRLVEGRKLIIGGVEIPFEKGLLGHSDADVLAHAVTDSLLGAAAMGDIGTLFPDTDPAYKGADSMALLKKVVGLISIRGFSIGNIDATVIAQSPKLSPFRDAIVKSMCKAMGIRENQFNFKAKTEEGLGFTGAGEGISAQALALLYKNSTTM